MLQQIYRLNKNNELSYVFGSGFFLAMNIKGIPFTKCLMTNNHILNEDYFKTNKQIEMEYKNEIKVIPISKRRIITSKRLDYTCIEIFDTDNIKRFFLINQQILISDLKIGDQVYGSYINNLNNSLILQSNNPKPIFNPKKMASLFVVDKINVSHNKIITF